MLKQKQKPVMVYEEAAEVLFPYLCPRAIATLALTCKALHRIARSVTAARSSDASRGLEKYPIPFLNNVDQHPYSYFIYSPISVVLPNSHPCCPSTWGGAPPKILKLQQQHFSPSSPPTLLSQSHPASIAKYGYRFGCYCDGDDGCCGRRVGRQQEESECSCCCMTLSPDDGDEKEGEELAAVITECGVNCRCGPRCQRRLTQGGIAVRLAVVRDSRKGWGLHAAQFIGSRDFICEYAGELVTTEEARRRQQEYDELASQSHYQFTHALLVVREHLPSRKACLRINIDATRVGNVARFINHSCDGGNLSTALVRNTGALLPRLCFFAARDIAEGEELSFSYGDTRMRSKGLPCFCRSSCCLGILPSEQI